MASLRAQIFAEIMTIFALGACDTFGPPPDEDVCGRGGAPCATVSSTAPAIPARPPNAVVPPTSATITSSAPLAGRPGVQTVAAAGRGGSVAGAGTRAVDWNDADAGVEPALVSVELSARHIVADAARSRIYATVGGNATSYANRLLSIDAQSAKVIRDIPIGSEPYTLALSDDGSTLWVSLSGSSAVRRVDIEGDELTAAEPNPLPTMCFGKPCVAGAMVVLPGSKGRVLAVLKESNNGDSSSGIALLENGVAQPNDVSPNSLFGITALSIGPAGYAFAYNGSNSGFELFALAISDTAQLTVTKHAGLVSGYNAELTYREGLVFASTGDVVDVKMPAAPMRAGHFATPGAMWPLPGKTGVLAVAIPNAVGGSNMGIPVTLSLLNIETFTVTKSAAVGTVTASSFMQPRDLVQVGAGLAFLTGRTNEASKIYVLQDIAELQSK